MAMMALDEFILWVNADKPYKTAKEYIDAAKAANGSLQDGRHRLQAGRPDHHRRAGEADRRQVHLHSVQGRRRGGGAARRQSRRFHRQQPDRGGGAVARRQARPLCVFDNKKLDYHDKIAGDLAWDSIPTCKSAGIDVEYLMLRGFFMAPGVTPEQVELLRRPVQEGARDAGVEEADERRRLQPDLHDREGISRLGRRTKKSGTKDLMKAAGFLAPSNQRRSGRLHNDE